MYGTASEIHMMTAKVRMPRTRCPAVLKFRVGGMNAIANKAATPMASQTSFDFASGGADVCT